MHFYRALHPVAAITFDLDDTLYDNGPVIRKTTEKSHAALQACHPDMQDFSVEDYQTIREQLLRDEPDLSDDVTEWRRRAVFRAMEMRGLTPLQATSGAVEVMRVFARWRSEIHIAAQTHTTLTALAQRFPLVAITNGNAQPARFGLDSYFQFVLRAGPDGRAKPCEDMYRIAAQRLGLSPQQILHVGDDLTTDVAGAVRFGMQACWINLHNSNLMKFANSRLLPTLEITQLASLTALI